MFGNRGILWPVSLSCGHLCLVTESALNVRAALCRGCPPEPWPIKAIVKELALRPAVCRRAAC